MPSVAQPLKNFPTFYGTLRYITAFTTAIHESLSWARSIQSISPHPISLRYILISSSRVRLRLPSGLFPSSYPTKILHAFLFSHACYMPCPSHLHHSNYTWRRVQVMKLLIMQFSPTSCHFIPLRTNYSPQHLFSNTLSLWSFLIVRDQVLHPSRIWVLRFPLPILVPPRAWPIYHIRGWYNRPIRSQVASGFGLTPLTIIN
jgi:hypothetical protein